MEKIVKGQIADASGHTDFTGTITEAMALIMDQVTKAGKWVYFNGNPFMFQDFSLQEQAEARNILEQAAEPTFVLTAKLQGGAVSINSKVVKEPLSKVLGKSNRAQMALSVTTKGGKPQINVLVSDYNGTRSKLNEHRATILNAVFNALADVNAVLPKKAMRAKILPAKKIKAKRK